jgi:hypothetical protein
MMYLYVAFGKISTFRPFPGLKALKSSKMAVSKKFAVGEKNKTQCYVVYHSPKL